MKLVSGKLRLSPHDLMNHLGCHHVTQLEMAVANGAIEPPDWRDPALAVLQERGLELEAAYLEHLRSTGRTISLPGDDDASTGHERTIGAMYNGTEIIYQAVLRNGLWDGRADFLIRADTASGLGAWSYEVLDTKLARETRAGTILQLCLYSDLLSEIQETMPAHMHVVMPGTPFDRVSYRVDDFLAYYRFVQARLLNATTTGNSASATYPDPVPHCDTCRWWAGCDKRRREDDHLCLVAGVSRLHIKELRSADVGTLTALADLHHDFRPRRGARETYVRAREQARVQLEGRTTGKPVFEQLHITIEQGLCRLPEPSCGDIFLDLEGDEFAGPHGLEFLFGWVTAEGGNTEYTAVWASDAASERKAFEAFMDFATERWQRFPDLHIYHFSGYEPGALKRLMGRYATREEELDRFLRAGRFVDLHSIVRQSVRASVERYSLKDLEPFHGFEREVALKEASLHLRAYERALELHQLERVDEATPAIIETYNRDDCLSTVSLRRWLEALRRSTIESGAEIARPELKEGAPSEDLDEHQQRIRALYEALTDGLPDDVALRNSEEQARWLLANMLDWHRREKKSVWWEYFRLKSLSDEELLDEKSALAGLQYERRMATPANSVIDRYRFPMQDCELRIGDQLEHRDGRCGTIAAIEFAASTVDIKKGPQIRDVHPTSAFKHDNINEKVKADAIERMARWVVSHGMDAPGPYRAGRSLLMRKAPEPSAKRFAGMDSLTAAREWSEALAESVLPIQGPPGAGKTYTGARMITHLVRAGKRVGIVALSHKVIRNLLEKTIEAAEAERTPLVCLQKVRDVSNDHAAIIETTANKDIDAAVAQGTADVFGGTSYLWARPEMENAVDVLFVDEAGQLALVDVLAVSHAATSLFLLGDPQQLKQPQQGTHPDGTDVSALEHILGEHQTLPPEQGLFLHQTFRMHPEICSFISEQFYENRLGPRPNLDRQVLSGDTTFTGGALWFAAVEHEGNQSASSEEADAVAEIVKELTSGRAFWTDAANDTHVVTADDILIIAPYNAQVAELSARLASFRIGTVDKFQGQEAPIVICSMATSSPEDAPRGMEFLYSRNRFNVAISRARAATILVASPKIFEPDCQSPAQMRLANSFCRYQEISRPAGITFVESVADDGHGSTKRPHETADTDR